MPSIFLSDVTDEPTDNVSVVPKPLLLIDSDVLPSGRTARAVRMRGKVQAEFTKASQRKGASAAESAMVDLVLGCTETVDGKRPTRDTILDMHAADVNTILLRVRRLTWPSEEKLVFVWHCAKPFVDDGCDTERKRPMQRGIPLDGLMYRPAVLPSPLTLASPRADGAPRVVTYAPPTYRASMAYAEKRQGDPSLDFCHLFESRAVMLDGERLTRAMYDDIGADDIDAIAAALGDRGGPLSDFGVTCPRCQAMYESRIEGLPGFFNPKAVRR